MNSRRIFFWLSVILFFSFELIFGKQGFYNLWKLKKEKRFYTEKVEKLRQENKKLMKEVYRLKNDPEYIEAIIKREMKMIRDNEVIVYFRIRNERQF